MCIPAADFQLISICFNWVFFGSALSESFDWCKRWVKTFDPDTCFFAFASMPTRSRDGREGQWAEVNVPKWDLKQMRWNDTLKKIDDHLSIFDFLKTNSMEIKQY